MRRWFVAGMAGLLVVIGSAAPASATVPAVPSVSLGAVTATSFTVRASATHATSFRVYYSLTKAALTVANITASKPALAFFSTTARSTSIPVTKLRYTTAPYYYRVRAYNGTAYKWGVEILSVGLKPAAPSGLAVASHSQAGYGTYLYWRSQSTGNGFLVTQASDAAMTSHVVRTSVNGPDFQFTPANLAKGSKYYFRVQARNLTTLSSSSAQVSFTAASTQSPVTVMTYNTLESRYDGTPEGGQTVAPWSKRGPVVAANIEQVKPDVVAIEEAGTFVDGTNGLGGTRQIDSLLSQLPGYSLARTEVPPTEHDYFRYGNYILYKTATIGALGPSAVVGGTDTPLQIGDDRNAAWQLLQVRATGAKFLFFAPHTLPTTTTDPKTQAPYDTDRENETKLMVAFGQHQSSIDGVRVVYAGDYNSDTVSTFHAFDGPGIVMRSSTYRNNDARDVAPTLTNGQFNSSNQYLRTPPASGDDIDHIYISPGIAVLSWGMVVDVNSKGQFVATIGSDHNAVYAKISIPS